MQAETHAQEILEKSLQLENRTRTLEHDLGLLEEQKSRSQEELERMEARRETLKMQALTFKQPKHLAGAEAQCQFAVKEPGLPEHEEDALQKEAAGQSKFLRDSKHAVHAKRPSQETGLDTVSTAGADATQQIIMVEIDEAEVDASSIDTATFNSSKVDLTTVDSMPKSPKQSIWQQLWSAIWGCAAVSLLYFVGLMWSDDVHFKCNQDASDAALRMICTGILVISVLDLFVDSWYLHALCTIGNGLWLCFLCVIAVTCVSQ